MNRSLGLQTQDTWHCDDRTPATLRQKDKREHLASVLRHIFFTALRQMRCADHQGFALTMYFEAEGLWHADQRIVGIRSDSAIDGRLSYEKSIRLRGYPHHRSSTESRHPALQRFGGAIRVVDGIVSIHGLPESDCELLVLCGSLSVGLITHKDASETLDASTVAQRRTGMHVDPSVRCLVWGLLDTVYGS